MAHCDFDADAGLRFRRALFPRHWPARSVEIAALRRLDASTLLLAAGGFSMETSRGNHPQEPGRTRKRCTIQSFVVLGIRENNATRAAGVSRSFFGHRDDGW